MNEVSRNVRYFVRQIDRVLTRDDGLALLKSFDQNSSDEFTLPKKKKFKKTAKSESTESTGCIDLNDLEFAVGVYYLLSINFKRYASKWNFSRLLSHLNSNQKQLNSLVKWFFIKIIALLLNFNETNRVTLLNLYLDSNEIENCYLKEQEIFIKHNNDLSFKFFSLKSLRTNFDQSSIDAFKSNIEQHSDLSSSNEDDDNRNETMQTNQMKHLDFNGLKLSIQKREIYIDDPAKNIVFVETTTRNLNKIVMSIITDTSIVVEGALSTGKTLLIEYLAARTNNKLVKYQMDEYMDSKSLIGNYVCSEIPGEFIWKPGPLYQAASQGYWLLLEDFDHSPTDSLSLLIDLLETKSIKTIDATIDMKSSFKLFLTMRPSIGSQSSSSSGNKTFIDTIKKQSRVVCLNECNDPEIIEIICSIYPYFRMSSTVKIAEKLLEIFKSLNFIDNSDTSFLAQKRVLAKEARVLSLRDLLKLCKRLTTVKDDSTKFIINLLNDIYECFLAFISTKQTRIEYAIEIGCKFNINKEEILKLFFENKPNFQKTPNELTCGRVNLKVQPKASRQGLSNDYNAKFVYTKSALNLLEKLARCIECNEPVLLCGETGVGKTTALQHLAKLLDKQISVINLNHQTETSDLLGSFKPVDAKIQMKLVKDKFMELFTRCFSAEENQTFLNHVQNCFITNNWKYLIKLLQHATNSSCKSYESKAKNSKPTSRLAKEWRELRSSLNKIEENMANIVDKFSFQFFEGKLAQAIQNGEWIILDEINLASSETLQFLSVLLEDTSSQNSSIILYEKGDSEPLRRHPNFRIFGAMNPANDIGKRNLPTNIRNRFTEIFVDELDDEYDLSMLVRSYLENLNDVSSDLVKSIVEFYINLRGGTTGLKKLSNGIGMPPTYSLRTLCRALRNASYNHFNNTLYSVCDSLCLSFLTDLNRESSILLEEYIKTSILKGSKSKLKNLKTKIPNSNFLGSNNQSTSYVNISGYHILKGPNECINQDDNSFIFTKSAEENLKRLVRVCSARLPCLIQGDTSIGKTSIVKWLAKATGNVFIRINNHDHTDLQEYIGSYVVDPMTSKLVFKEGLLVTAMRNGYWILLDELNLASSEVLEALNRVLDDNRELYIPETQEIVKAHERFLLFATQNPPGKYAGRKQLSRAFRNRFIELHFDELPEDELLIIVERKCNLPKSYATLLIRTITELKTKRSQVSGIFLGKNSLITLRDLFRWAKRFSMADVPDNQFEDWKQYLAEQGFLLLSSRCRSEQDVLTIHSCIQKVFNKKIDLNNLYNPHNLTKPIMDILNNLIDYSKMNFKDFVWTPSARRTALLVGLAYKYNEPFLLVGETGVGKTTICQMLSELNKKHLHIINCHMHSEAADFLGSMRPVREELSEGASKQLFEWKDGPLVEAIKYGNDFLIDEISLAEDSVLERLNSVLEEEKTLLLAENISNGTSDCIKANDSFRIFATMNPSGDFGKKELSAALRNRFTEIWCPSALKSSNSENADSYDEFKIICQQRLDETNDQIKFICIQTIDSFLKWLNMQTFFSKIATFSIRDLISWIKFINLTSQTILEAEANTKILSSIISLIHGACLVFIDSLCIDQQQINNRNLCIKFLFDKIQDLLNQNVSLSIYNIEEIFNKSINKISNDDQYLSCGPFRIKKPNSDKLGSKKEQNLKYCLNSDTTVKNIQRILRCLLMDQPIMLEGSPGVGKTSLVEALAHVTNNRVIRINLSEQTDLNELFGADLPCKSNDNNTVNSNKQQIFNWHDGPFLSALKQGDWVILDEINLASQSVLEGLNSCFDHRGEVYISELNRHFRIDRAKTKIFACQNPFSQGGGRKGLPKSFLNRFSKVYIDQMSHEDLLFITSNMYQNLIDMELLSKMITFNERLNQEICVEKKWGTNGSPWEFNLRDLFRWCDILVRENRAAKPGDYIHLIYASRFRSQADKQRVFECFSNVFGYQLNYEPYRQENASKIVRLNKNGLQIGQSFLNYDNNELNLAGNDSILTSLNLNKYTFTNSNLKYLESIAKCIEMNWMCILVGKSCAGKTTLIRLLANLMRKNLVEFPVNNLTDTNDLLGGFEKVKQLRRDLELLNNELKAAYLSKIYEKTNIDLINNYLKFKYESTKLMTKLNKGDNNNNTDEIKYLKMLSQLFEINLSDLNNSGLFVNTALNNLKILYKKIVDQINDKLNNQSTANKTMKFEWLDSNLVRAIENGDWVLIDNANFCSPSVLDRLNPLLEPNGSLQINEKVNLAQDETKGRLKPHKNFRIFLCMNESFGELSRPMRNRGIEIYINELDLICDKEDIKLVLKQMFPFLRENTLQFDCLFDKLVVMLSNVKLSSFNSNRFSYVIKIFKLAYDFWLLNHSSMTECVKRALIDLELDNEPFMMDLDESMLKLDLNNRPTIQNYTDIFQLKEFKIYKFLFEFPLFAKFLDRMTTYVNLNQFNTSYDLSNYSLNFINSVKTTQLINIWLQNIQLDSINPIIRFTILNLKSKAVKRNAQEHLKYFENFIVDELLNSNQLFHQYVTFLQVLCETTGLEFLNESIDPFKNVYLCNKLSTSQWEQLSILSSLLDFKVSILMLSKFRMIHMYKIQEDSLMSLSNKMDVIHLENQKQKSVKIKFVSFIKELFNLYLNDLIKSVNNIDLKNKLNDINSSIFILEKFYLIASSCKFNSELTFAYLKYYWNFFKTFLSQNLGVEYSNDFQAIFSSFDQNLYFDDSLYKMYYKLWSAYKPKVFIDSLEMLKSIRTTNEILTGLSVFNTNITKTLNSKNLLKLINQLANFSKIQDYLAKINVTPYAANETNENVFNESFDIKENNHLKQLSLNCENLPVKHYVQTLLDIYSLINSNTTNLNQKLEFTTKNFNQLATNSLICGNFYSIYSSMCVRSFDFMQIIDNLIDQIQEDCNNQEELNDQQEIEPVKKFILNKYRINKDDISSNHLSFIHYNWLDEYLTKQTFKRFKSLADTRKHTPQLIQSIQLELSFYDKKLAKINELNSFMWSNYSFLANNFAQSSKIDSYLLDVVSNCLNNLKLSQFENDDKLFYDYLISKGFDKNLFELRRQTKFNTQIELLIAGCMLAYLFCPIEPLDPVEHEQLISNSQKDELELSEHEKNLSLENSSKIKSEASDITPSINVNELKLALRENKADYFLIKNDLDNALIQLCSYLQLNKFISKFDDDLSKDHDKLEQEFKTWSTSIERLIEKLMNKYYSYSDIVYLPVNGISLIGYSMSSMFTQWCLTNKQSHMTSLIKLLLTYPFKNDYSNLAEKIFHYSSLMSTNDNYNLSDELNYLTFLYIGLAIRTKKAADHKPFDLFYKLCEYFNQRFKLYSKIKEEEEQVSEYKYKTFGETKIESELDGAELNDRFPSYTDNFKEFIDIDPLNNMRKLDENQENESKIGDDDLANQASKANKSYLLNTQIFSQTFDIIDLILIESNQVSVNEELLLKTFYRSYSISSSLLSKYDIKQPVDESNKQTLLSHLLFSSSVFLNNQSLDLCRQSSSFNIYFESNTEQILKCKRLLDILRQKIDNLLIEWSDNPILIELIKIINRIESFNLNDPLMKYLTGIELLLEKSDKWQMIASKQFSLEAELRSMNELVIEWRKMELKHWLLSLDNELDEFKKKYGYHWFFFLFSVCVEQHTKDSNDDMNPNELLKSLKSFIESSCYGEYSLRIKILKICLNLFEKISKKRSLVNCLWSVINYYETIYSKLIEDEMSTEKQIIQKELKSFVDIYKWQDANYTALKLSTLKSTKTLYKTLKKYRTYLKQPIQFNNLINLNKFQVNLVKNDDKEMSKQLRNAYQLSKTLGVNIEAKNYHFRMIKLCKQLLIKKHRKNLLNESIETFTIKTYNRYIELDKETRTLMNLKHDANKEEKSKQKKDMKNLNTQKCKFVSDLIKELNSFGISYRKGTIHHSQLIQNLDQILLISKPNHLSSMKYFPQSEYNYYLCLANYVGFKSNQQASTSIPMVNQFTGYADHFFYLISQQKLNINKFLINFGKFENLKHQIDLIANSEKYLKVEHLNVLNSFLNKSATSCKQIDLFFKNHKETNQTIKQSYDSIRSEFDMIRSRLEEQETISLQPDDNFKSLLYLDTERLKIFNELTSNYEAESLFNKNLLNLIETSTFQCIPFENEFKEILVQMNLIQPDLSAISIEVANSSEIEDQVKNLNILILKSIENFYKKYEKFESEVSSSIYNKKNTFVDECYTSLIGDLELFNLSKINKAIRKLFNNIDNTGQIESLQLNILKVYLNIFMEFMSKWIVYLIDTHLKASKSLNILLYVFNEFKVKGLTKLPELDDEEEGDEENDVDNKSKKFEEDNEDPSGLGEGQGAKDVSDQIETEDQLEDAKQKDADKDKEKEEEDENKEEIKENENGIEMSDDFEGDLNDVEMEEEDEKKKDNEKNNEESDEELDDQKGKVDQTSGEALDNQLWSDEEDDKDDGDDEDNKDDGDDNIDEKEEGGAPIKDNNNNELMAKDEELPMMDKGEDDEMNAGDSKEEQEEFGEQDELPKDGKNESEDENELDLKEHEENDTAQLDEDNNNEAKEDNENSDENITETKIDDIESNDEEADKNEDEKDKLDQEDLSKPNKNSYSQSIADQLNQQENNELNENEDLNEMDEEGEEELESKEINDNIENDQTNNNNSNQKSSSINSQSNSEFNKLNIQNDQTSDKDEENKQKPPSKSNQNRVLADKIKRPPKKRQDLIDEKLHDDDDKNKMDEEVDEEVENNKKSFKHIKNENEKSDYQMYDAATEEQKNSAIDEEDNKEENEKNLDENNLPSEEKKLESKENDKKDLEESKQNLKKQTRKNNQNETSDVNGESNSNLENSDEGIVETYGPFSRNAAESLFDTNLEHLRVTKTREELEQDLLKFREMLKLHQTVEKNDNDNMESLKLWLDYECLTQQLSKELCEQLRLILEPTICSKLKGDYKTGKRLNMKRVVEYIATEYRKDKIWLRRTKPNKRDYQVMLAVDNSSSMGDNHCVQLAYESIATLTNAFNFLEVGQFGLLSFGEKVNELHGLQDHFNSDVGAKILSNVNFMDERTNIAEMLHFTIDLFNKSESKSMRNLGTGQSVPVSKLLIILSDGKGIFYEGIDKVKNSVQRALQNGLFILFIILDTSGKNSIFDIKMPIYTEGSSIPTIKSYMESFPFPFYIVLREIGNLPIIMIEALKQWFDLVSRNDNL